MQLLIDLVTWYAIWAGPCLIFAWVGDRLNHGFWYGLAIIWFFVGMFVIIAVNAGTGNSNPDFICLGCRGR